MRAFAALAALLMAALLIAGGVVQAAECPASPVQALQLPHLKQVIGTGHPAVIVAVGSSSTQGWRASDPAHSYPAILQDRLNRDLPGAHVAVINRGIGGQDAAQETARLQVDVLAVKPQLVIWQVGANGALRDVPPDTFQKLVAAGLKLLRESDVDVVLMDNQRAPAIQRADKEDAIDHVLGELARADGIGLFSRARMMDAWHDAGMPYTAFIDKDGLHHNDLGYRCLAESLAVSVVQAVK